MQRKILLRKDAIYEGSSRYFTGQPCKYGHIAERNTSTSGCCQCLLLRSRLNRRTYNENRIKDSMGFIEMKVKVHAHEVIFVQEFIDTLAKHYLYPGKYKAALDVGGRSFQFATRIIHEISDRDYPTAIKILEDNVKYLESLLLSFKLS